MVGTSLAGSTVTVTANATGGAGGTIQAAVELPETVPLLR